jgi:beta-lactamase regulating signal transducer with metallopeptidase domain/HEAT repeat protein
MSHQTIGWALIHSLWQAAGLAALLAAGLAVTRNARPALRYALAIAVLFATAAFPVATVTWLGPAMRDADAVPLARGDADTGPALGNSIPRRNAPAANAPALHEGSEVLPASPPLARLRARVEAALPLLVQLWTAGMLLAAARLAGGMLALRRVVRRDALPPTPSLCTLTQRLARRMRVPGLVAVRESARLQVPVVVGWLRPLILVPTALANGLAPATLEALVAHELAHIRRYDVLVNLLQRVIETVFFFHPAVWWISARVREEREQCCDDLAVRAVGGDVATYAAALLSLEESRDPRLATGLAASGGPLLRRVERLVDGRAGRVELGAAWMCGVLGLLAALVSTGSAPPARELDRTAPVGPAAPVEWRPVAPSGGKGWHTVSQGSLVERWVEATRRGARGAGAFWIGYVLPGPRPGGRGYHFDDSVTIRLGGERARGLVVMDENRLASARIPGEPLESRPETVDPSGVAILAGFEAASGAAPRLTRIHAASTGLPAHLGPRAVYWLGEAPDAASVKLLRALFATVPKHLQRDLVATVGIHTDGEAAAAALASWLGDRQLRGRVREEAAHWLGRHPTPRALFALSAAARQSEDRDVAGEAIEALGRLPLDGATDTLLRVATASASDRLRERAVEALGDRGPRATPHLAALASAPNDPELQAEAVAALARASTDSALTAVARILHRHDRPSVRRRAARAMARAAHPATAIRVLHHSLRTDPDDVVRLEAVKSMRRVRSVPLAVQALAALARDDESAAVRRTAVRALGGLRRHPLAREALRDLSRADIHADVREQARAILDR